MKDKLFWIALIFAGFYLFNKMKSSNANQDVNSQIEKQSDYSPENRQSPAEIEPNYGDNDKPLNLPNKNGQTQQQNPSRDFPINQPVDKAEKDISLGKYGSVKLPKKSGTSATTGGSSTTGSTNTNSSSSSPERMLVKLDPQTAIGDGTLNSVNGASRVVFEGKSFQVSNSSNLNVYIDTGGFSTLTDCSSSTIYVKSSAQLMVTGDGRNNTIYYESGATIRNGLSENLNNRFIQVREIVFD